MKKMMVSIKPVWIKKILKGEKEVEFRSWRVPKETEIFFYCSKSNEKKDSFSQKVVAKAKVKKVIEIKEDNEYNISSGYVDQKYAILLEDVEKIPFRKITDYTKKTGEKLRKPPQSRVWIK